MRAEIQGEEWLTVLARGAFARTARGEPLVQGVGTTRFTLLAVVVTDDTSPEWGERLYIGPGAWDRVSRVCQHLTYQTLTPAAQDALAATVEGIVWNYEPRVLDCFNTTFLDGFAGHPLELLSGLEAECRDAIIRERTRGRFTDVADLQARVDCLQHPHDLVARRVVDELQAGDESYSFLTE